MRARLAFAILCAALTPVGLAFAGPHTPALSESPNANAVAVQLEESSEEEAARVSSDGQRQPRPRAVGRLRAMGPDGWHRIALYGNWDFIEPEIWRWIVTRPDCDRATALTIFWKAQPGYYVQFADRVSVPEVNRDTYDLVMLIRDRWLAGAYTRSELAFDRERDSGPVDIAGLEQRHGDTVARTIPPSMWINLPGRRIANAGPPFSAVLDR